MVFLQSKPFLLYSTVSFFICSRCQNSYFSVVCRFIISLLTFIVSIYTWLEVRSEVGRQVPRFTILASFEARRRWKQESNFLLYFSVSFSFAHVDRIAIFLLSAVSTAHVYLLLYSAVSAIFVTIQCGSRSAIFVTIQCGSRSAIFVTIRSLFSPLIL